MCKMQIRIIALTTFLALACSVEAEDKPADPSRAGKHLFILSGQSNMAGLKPEISFTPAVEAAFGKDNVVVVKDAQGSQPIRKWYRKWKPAEGGKEGEIKVELYDRLMGKVNQAIKEEAPTTVTFVWMQGEADSKEGSAEVYAASLKGLINQLATDLGRKYVNFVIGRLSDNGQTPQWKMVREAQVAVAEGDPRGAWVDTDDLNDKKKGGEEVFNDLHYTAEGYKLLGQRFAEKAIGLIEKQKTGKKE